VDSANSLTTLQPLGVGSYLARDLGTGVYRINVDGIPGPNVRFEVHVDGVLVNTITLPVSGCA